MGKQIPMVGYLVLDDGAPHLVANECGACGAHVLRPPQRVRQCGGREFSAAALADDGMVRSFTIVHRAAPGVPTPYVSAVVDLDGGGTVKATSSTSSPTRST